LSIELSWLDLLYRPPARKLTGMAAWTVQIVMLVCQDGRGARSLQRAETF
jgi:hypothetical protein